MVQLAWLLWGVISDHAICSQFLSREILKFVVIGVVCLGCRAATSSL